MMEFWLDQQNSGDRFPKAWFRWKSPKGVIVDWGEYDDVEDF